MRISKETFTLNPLSAIKYVKYHNLNNLLHWHDEIELIHIVQGSAEISVNGELYRAKKKDLILINSRDTHYINSDSDTIIEMLIFNKDIVKILNSYTLITPVINNISDTSFDRIIAEKRTKSAFYNNYIYNIVENLVIDILRNNEYIKKEQYYSNEKVDVFKKLINYIDENYNTITFDEAKNMMSYTSSYFSKIFAEISGVSFTKYLNQVRINNSIKMLKTTHKNVSEIAMECGFGTIRHFNRVFKEVTGYSPKEYPYEHIKKQQIYNNFDPTLSQSTVIIEYND